MDRDLGPTKFDVDTFTTDQEFATLAGRRIRKWIDTWRDRSKKVANHPNPAVFPAPSACKDHADEETLRIRKEMLRIRKKQFENDLLSYLKGIQNSTRQLKPENLLIACAMADFGTGIGCETLSAKAWNKMATWSMRFVKIRARQSRCNETQLHKELVSLLCKRPDDFKHRFKQLLILSDSNACDRISRVYDALAPTLVSLHHKRFRDS